MRLAPLPPSRAEQIASFERVGESELRFMLVEQFPEIIFDEEVAKEWLLSKERERTDSAALARDAREEETLSIARSARKDARDARIIALIAAAIAAITSIVIAILR